jgi:type III restriction enzyme
MSELKFKFEDSQQYQLDAIAAMTDIFTGAERADPVFAVVKGIVDEGALPGMGEFGGFANPSLTNLDALRENVRSIQMRNGIFVPNETAPLDSWKVKDSTLDGEERACPHFSIEMETGTGKTYVYLRTMMELSQKYGMRKFVVVVPSIAIREGVKKAIDQTQEHFQTLFNGSKIESFIYDSGNVSRLRNFASANTVQVMIINIQAFIRGYSEDEADDGKPSNVIYREMDVLSGKRPIDFIKTVRPIVVIDEPQSVDSGEKARAALKQLNPLCTMRYSATHANEHNLMYRLDPIKAFRLKLVKQIKVASANEVGGGTDAFVAFEKATTNASGIKAEIVINYSDGRGFDQKSIKVKKGDDLYAKSNEIAAYKTGFKIKTINATPGAEYLELANGSRLKPGESIGGISDDIWKAQIDLTVEMHFKKEQTYGNLGVKILSLFFIDKVANYRGSPFDPSIKGKVAVWFEESFKKWASSPQYKNLRISKIPVQDVHKGYFSQDKKGFIDSEGENENADTYDLIMKDKERLLSLDEPTHFIFSHSALREGWDSPNVFQICTLRATKSLREKRQTIGRGLRIPVNQEGERVRNNSLNVLTVVVNDSYKSFAEKLQVEYEKDCGVKFGFVTPDLIVDVVRNGVFGDQTIDPKEAQRRANEIIKWLVEVEVIDNSGRVKEKFDPKDDLSVEIPEEFTRLKDDILKVCAGVRTKNHIAPVENFALNKRKEERFKSKEFESLWKSIRSRTRYYVEFDSRTVVKMVKERLEDIQISPKISKPKIVIEMGRLQYSQSGIETEKNVIERTRSAEERAHQVTDIVAWLVENTRLTRKSIVEILRSIKPSKLSEVFVNEQVFLEQVRSAIEHVIGDVCTKTVVYEKRSPGDDDEFLMDKMFCGDEEIDLNRSVKIEKGLYDYVVCDSDTEKKFAAALDLDKRAKLIVKLPDKYEIETPVGGYNPDWAIVLEDGEVVYLVRETKGGTDLEKLQFPKEKMKILYGVKHFDAIGADYDWLEKASQVKPKSRAKRKA